jgi:exodeoxyribonuclease VII large subunit
VISQHIKEAENRWGRFADLLESYSFERVLERGYAVVLDENARPVTAAAVLKPSDAVKIKFTDGSKNAIITSETAASTKPMKSKPGPTDKRQGHLL